MWALIVNALMPICPIHAAALNREVSYLSDSYDQSTYEPSKYYKMYAAHYEVTTYEYTYPRIHADAISYSADETESPVYITPPPRRRQVNKHTKNAIRKGQADPSYHTIKAPKEYLAPKNYYEA